MLSLDFNFVLEMINLVILYLLLRKFLIGPIMNIMENYALPKREFYEWHVGNGCGYLVELDSFLWGKDRRILQVIEKRDGEEIH